VVDMGDDGEIAELGEIGGHARGRLAGGGAWGKGGLCSAKRDPIEASDSLPYERGTSSLAHQRDCRV
jgi:hypothetical protein